MKGLKLIISTFLKSNVVHFDLWEVDFSSYEDGSFYNVQTN